MKRTRCECREIALWRWRFVSSLAAIGTAPEWKQSGYRPHLNAKIHGELLWLPVPNWWITNNRQCSDNVYLALVDHFMEISVPIGRDAAEMNIPRRSITIATVDCNQSARNHLTEPSDNNFDHWIIKRKVQIRSLLFFIVGTLMCTYKEYAYSMQGAHYLVISSCQIDDGGLSFGGHFLFPPMEGRPT